MTETRRFPQLSLAAEKALLGTESSRQGARIPRTTQPAIVVELQIAELIGGNCGLTRRGTIIREKLFESTMDELF